MPILRGCDVYKFNSLGDACGSEHSILLTEPPFLRKVESNLRVPEESCSAWRKCSSLKRMSWRICSRNENTDGPWHIGLTPILRGCDVYKFNSLGDACSSEHSILLTEPLVLREVESNLRVPEESCSAWRKCSSLKRMSWRICSRNENTDGPWHIGLTPILRGCDVYKFNSLGDACSSEHSILLTEPLVLREVESNLRVPEESCSAWRKCSSLKRMSWRICSRNENTDGPWHIGLTPILRGCDVYKFNSLGDACSSEHSILLTEPLVLWR